MHLSLNVACLLPIIVVSNNVCWIKPRNWRSCPGRGAKPACKLTLERQGVFIFVTGTIEKHYNEIRFFDVKS